jgi:hypothetical protein
MILINSKNACSFPYYSEFVTRSFTLVYYSIFKVLTTLPFIPNL